MSFEKNVRENSNTSKTYIYKVKGYWKLLLKYNMWKRILCWFQKWFYVENLLVPMEAKKYILFLLSIWVYAQHWSVVDESTDSGDKITNKFIFVGTCRDGSRETWFRWNARSKNIRRAQAVLVVSAYVGFSMCHTEKFGF